MKYRDWKLRRHIKKYDSKNKGYFNYFNQEWFNKHRKTLLFLLNHWALKYWFRWILRIHRDVSFKSKINLILPHAYWFDAKYINDGKDIEVKTDFRTHQKFSKRIYYAFRPLWWALHCLDWIIQQTLAPEFSFGFDTLTVYPDANPETTTVDGYAHMQYSNLTWAEICAASGNAVDDTSAYLSLYTNGFSATEWERLRRIIMLFDTSALTSDANISSAVMSLYVYSKSDGVGVPDNRIVSSNPASNTVLANSDYTNLGTTNFGNDSLSTTGAYTDIALNSSGQGNISKTGISKFGIRYGWDIDVSAPTWTVNATYRWLYGADQTGTSQDPKLVVTYTLPSTFVPQVIMI